jgi:hypothetical protein
MFKQNSELIAQMPIIKYPVTRREKNAMISTRVKCVDFFHALITKCTVNTPSFI